MDRSHTAQAHAHLIRDPPSRPSSTGPSSSSTTLEEVPSLARPSSYLVRPHLGVQTRLRARSITSGSGASSPVPTLSPTLVGSPILPGVESFLDDASLTSNEQQQQRSDGGNASAAQRASLQQPALTRRSTDPGHLLGSTSSLLRSVASRSRLRELSDEDEEEDEEEEESRAIDASSDGVPSLQEHEGSSTDSDELPATPADGRASPYPTWSVTSPSGTHLYDKRIHARYPPTPMISLEGSTRHEIRRGRSFTSLLVQPVTPSPAVVERPDPILEHVKEQEHDGHSPTPSDIESGSLVDEPTDDASTKSLRDFVPQVVTLLVLFLSSFAVIALLIATLPGLFIPHSVADLPALTAALSTYRGSSWFAELHLFVVLTALFLWKQCFSIPGSILTNILFGALYGTAAGTWWACLWTALGSTGAYGIALVIAPLVEYYFAKPLDVTRRALKLAPSALSEGDAPITPLSPGDLFTHLLLARFFPLLPYSVLNVISGVLRLPLPTFFLTLVLGSFPFNFVTVSIGAVVSLAAADPTTPLSNKIWSREVLTKLILVTLVSVLPIAFKKQLKEMVSSPQVARVVTQLSAVPTIVGYVLSIYKDALVRKLFGFGALAAGPNWSNTSGGEAQRGWKRQQRAQEWSRKVSRSSGGYESVATSDGAEELELGASWVPLGD